MGGWIGSILIGVFADPILGGPAASGEQFAKQLAAAVGTAVYSFIVSFVLLHLVNLITPVVPSDADIAEGLDSSMHGAGCGVRGLGFGRGALHLLNPYMHMYMYMYVYMYMCVWCCTCVYIVSMSKHVLDMHRKP
ncbi:hypothetical protein T484DRAFT_2610272 [Baffinella frigidus]|nr:hypothetical protein T484DRAFT_2610272 [Cryptophyta sp. CCMP2293]